MRAALFDIGGVLLHSRNAATTAARWVARLGLDPGVMESAISDVLAQGDAGLLEEEQFWVDFATSIGASDVIDELRNDAWWWDEMDVELVEFIASVRPRIRTGIVSNARRGTGLRAERTFGLCGYFDTVVISGEEGFMKPDERIYRIACERLGIEPAEAVFVDDFDTNVEAARLLGMRAILHRNSVETIASLRTYLS